MVDTEEKLAAFLHSLRSAGWLAVDTEADSLHAYPEKVCLIQVSTATEDRLVDPLANIDLDPLLKAFSHHELIMHGADYDLRLFRKHQNFVPKAIFDTMLGARLLGVRQFGLSSLVEHYLGVRLEKGTQKANWALRPLTPRMEKYARNDTHYLKPLADKIGDELRMKGRLAWHRECCARLVTDASLDPAPNPDLVWRLKGSQRLDRRGLGVLRDLWRWREKEALAANRPPFFVLSHDLLLFIAAKTVRGEDYQSLLPRHLSERRRVGLAKVISHALQLPLDHCPKLLRNVNRRPSEAEKRQSHELRRRRDARALALSIDPTLIASRAMLAALSYDWDKYSAELMTWQRDLLES